MRQLFTLASRASSIRGLSLFVAFTVMAGLLPCSVSRDSGASVPIPTLPEASIRMASAPPPTDQDIDPSLPVPLL